MCFTIFLLLSFLCVGAVSPSDVILAQLTSDNWDQILEGEWVIKFYAPWCPACRAMEDEYKLFAAYASTLGVKVAEVDITKESGLSGRFVITALPTIYHAYNGEFRRFSGKRSADYLQDYVEKKLWKETDPISGYRHPSSILMHLMSALFRMSMWMKDFMDLLTETYGFSTLAAYAIFGIAVIATGLALGLVLVLLIDCISPPRRKKAVELPPVPTETKEEKEVASNPVPVDPKPSKETLEEEKEEEEDVENKSQSSQDEDDEVPLTQRSSKSSSQSSSFEKIAKEEVEDEGGDTATNVRQRKKHTETED